jgi:hypothetical protein
MPTLLAKRPNKPIVARDDTHLETMAADPSIPVISEGSTWQDTYESSYDSQYDTQQNSNFVQSTVQKTPISPSPLSESETLVKNTNNHWINNRWRPAMGWMYMGVCVTDFVLFPVLWSVLQATFNGNVTDKWEPLTLQGAGLFHMAMGAVLGIVAYGRTKEKVEGKS